MRGIPDLASNCFVLRLHPNRADPEYISLLMLAYTLDREPSGFQIRT